MLIPGTLHLQSCRGSGVEQAPVTPSQFRVGLGLDLYSLSTRLSWESCSPACFTGILPRLLHQKWQAQVFLCPAPFPLFALGRASALPHPAFPPDTQELLFRAFIVDVF